MTIKNYIRQITPGPVLRAKRSLTSRLDTQRLKGRDAVITQSRGKEISAAHTFVVICGPYFDQRVPNAGVTCRTGLARAFQEIGIPYEFVSVRNVRRVNELPEPIIFLAESDFNFLDRTQINELRKHRHFVWVNPWFQDANKFYEARDFDLVDTPGSLRKRVLDSEPAFLYTPVTESGLNYYSGWAQRGQKLISLPLACDTDLYDVLDETPKFDQVGMAFVGGYWPYKARNFDLYLKPHEQRLTVFGYSPWPYAGYGGQISAEDEPLLYRDATLSPAINEPHAAVLGGDICERVYKVLGSGGLCITDVTSAHRDIFDSSELLVPESVDEYHEMVRAVFNDPEQFNSYRENGYRAIRARHTYQHRAREILKWLDLADSYGVKPAPENRESLS